MKATKFVIATLLLLLLTSTTLSGCTKTPTQSPEALATMHSAEWKIAKLGYGDALESSPPIVEKNFNDTALRIHRVPFDDKNVYSTDGVVFDANGDPWIDVKSLQVLTPDSDVGSKSIVDVNDNGDVRLYLTQAAVFFKSTDPKLLAKNADNVPVQVLVQYVNNAS